MTAINDQPRQAVRKERRGRQVGNFPNSPSLASLVKSPRENTVSPVFERIFSAQDKPLSWKLLGKVATTFNVGLNDLFEDTHD